jgi:transposase-like protein
MKHFTPEQKHEILMEYQRYSRTHSFSSLALRHSVHDGERTVRNWYQRWDGTVASLQQRKGAGRPNILTPTEVQHNIQQPIRRSNRLAQQVKYTKIAEQVRQNTGKSVSVQTVRRIGKQQLGASRKRGKKRTAAECRYIHT